MDNAELVAKTLAILEDCQKDRDTEAAHGDADDALVNFLNELGYTQITAAYALVNKWYA